MEINKYLEKLLGRSEADKLRSAIMEGKTIIINGTEGPTGKTTLYRVLRKAGASVAEKFDTYEINVCKPLEQMTPSIDKTISF